MIILPYRPNRRFRPPRKPGPTRRERRVATILSSIARDIHTTPLFHRLGLATSGAGISRAKRGYDRDSDRSSSRATTLWWFPTLRPPVLEAGRRRSDSRGKSEGYSSYDQRPRRRGQPGWRSTPRVPLGAPLETSNLSRHSWCAC